LSVAELRWGGLENHPESLAENRLLDGSLADCESVARSLFAPASISPGKPKGKPQGKPISARFSAFSGSSKGYNRATRWAIGLQDRGLLAKDASMPD
jgi:hypothetical protein